jgi:hypothetical protein
MLFLMLWCREGVGCGGWGAGAGVYGFVGGWMPGGLVSWMLGVRGQGREEDGGRFVGNGGRLIEEGRGDSEGEGSVGSEREGGLGESGYVYPQRDDGEASWARED